MVEARGGRDAAQPRAERRVAAIRRQAAQCLDSDLLEGVVHELTVAQHAVGDHAQTAVVVTQDRLEGPRVAATRRGDDREPNLVPALVAAQRGRHVEHRPRRTPGAVVHHKQRHAPPVAPSTTVLLTKEGRR